MSLLVRTATAADVPAMHEIRMSVRENRLSDPQRITEASYWPYIEAASAWVAMRRERIVGFAAVDGSSQVVWALFVHPGVEGCGIGRALHKRLLQWANEQKITRLSLSTAKNTRAASFYRSAGWIDVGSTADGEIMFAMSIAS